LMIIAALCEGAFLVLYNAAEVTAVQRVVTSEELPAALAMNEARGHLAIMAGKPLGGFLFGQRALYPYYLSIVASLWTLVTLVVLGRTDYRPQRTDRPSNATPRFSLFDGVRMVILNPFLRTVVVVCAVGNFLFQIVLLLLVVLGRQQHLSSTRIGLLLATSGVCGLLGSLIAPVLGRRVRDERRIVVFCAVAWVVLTGVVAVWGHPVPGFIAWGGLSITGGFLNVAILNHQTERIPDHLLGRVMGINRFFTSGAVPLGALSAGYIVARLHPRSAAWLACGLITLMAAAVPFLLNPRWFLPGRTLDGLKERLTAKESREPATAAR
jgi:predicted MFS family arabinose efflux permease